MLLNPLPGWLRLGSPALVVLALVFTAAVASHWRASAGPPVVDAGVLAADPSARQGSEVIVTGEWDMAGPSERGHMVVLLRGRDGGRVACHFEDVPEADRAGLEGRLPRIGRVAIRGRCAGVERAVATLRGCVLLD
jgi:hypothetical protein